MATILEELALIYGDDISTSRELLSSTTSTVHELQSTFEEKFPYSVRALLTGDEYVFGETFIDKIRYAMSTDYLGFLDTLELETFEIFTQYQDEFSTTADATLYPTAIGCTVPDESGNSYVIDETGITTNLCTIVPSELLQTEIVKSLDATLMKIVNCQDYLPVTIAEEDLVNVSESCLL